MARFRYLGEPPRPYVESYGPCEAINCKMKDGSTEPLTPIPPATEFVIGDDIGYDIEDERCLRAFRADPRFQEIF